MTGGVEYNLNPTEYDITDNDTIPIDHINPPIIPTEQHHIKVSDKIELCHISPKNKKDTTLDGCSSSTISQVRLDTVGYDYYHGSMITNRGGNGSKYRRAVDTAGVGMSGRNIGMGKQLNSFVALANRVEDEVRVNYKVRL